MRETKLNIKAEDIDVKQHFFNAFDNTVTEISAKWIVKLYQKLNRDLTESFTQKEIDDFYHKTWPRDNFTFNRLIKPEKIFENEAAAFRQVGGGFIIECDDGSYELTDDFVLRCYNASPKKKED